MRKYRHVISGFGIGGKILENLENLPYAALRDIIFTHPAMTEAVNDLFAGLK